MIMASDFGGMNNARLDALVRDIGSDVEGPLGFWEFTVNGCRLYCITDESHDRMRIMTPIATRDEISDQQFL